MRSTFLCTADIVSNILKVEPLAKGVQLERPVSFITATRPLLVHSVDAVQVSGNTGPRALIVLIAWFLVTNSGAAGGAGTNTTAAAPATVAVVGKGRRGEEKRAIRSRVVPRGLSYWI